MATTLSAVTTVSVAAHFEDDVSPGDVAADLALQLGAALTPGAAAGQANVPYWATRTLAASASEQLDLAGTTLLDPLKNQVSLARVKVLAVTADAANVNNVVVGGGSNAFASIFGAAAHTTPVRPGGLVLWCCGPADGTGYVVTAGTGDLLQIANSGAGSTVTYTIVVIGTAT